MNLILMQIGDGNLNAVLFMYGPLGIMCSWMMWQFPKMVGEIRNLSHRIDGMTRAMLVDVLSRNGSVNPAAHKAAQEMLAKIEAREQLDRERS